MLRVLERLGEAALIEALPLTGRTHQIRLHMAELGHALVGDAKYGGLTNWRGELVAAHRLHAWRLRLPHPRTRALLELEAPLPDWWITASQSPDSQENR
jgi:23S rRNA pseudouridine1911/1915/1917 synthase